MLNIYTKTKPEEYVIVEMDWSHPNIPSMQLESNQSPIE